MNAHQLLRQIGKIAGAATWPAGDQTRVFRDVYFIAGELSEEQIPPGLGWLVLSALAGSSDEGEVPNGLRIVLSLPPGASLSGDLVRDWVRPTLEAGRL